MKKAFIYKDITQNSSIVSGPTSAKNSSDKIPEFFLVDWYDYD